MRNSVANNIRLTHITRGRRQKMHRGNRNEAGKLFIGGLSWDTNQETLMGYFSQYGEVCDCVVMKNPANGKSRGFGFVTFKDPKCVETVLAVQAHVIDGRQVDAKACNPKSQNAKGNQGMRQHRGGGGGGGGGMGQHDPDKHRKIFMGGLPNVDEDFLVNFFSKYGKVTDVTIVKDMEQKKSRGFGFLTFESEESIDRVCQERYVHISGKKVEVKKAQPRDGRQGPGNMGGPGPMGGPPGHMGPNGPMPGGHQDDWGGHGNNWNPPGGPRPGPGYGSYQAGGYQQTPPQQPPYQNPQQPPNGHQGFPSQGPGFQQPGFQQQTPPNQPPPQGGWAGPTPVPQPPPPVGGTSQSTPVPQPLPASLAYGSPPQSAYGQTAQGTPAGGAYGAQWGAAVPPASHGAPAVGQPPISTAGYGYAPPTAAAQGLAQYAASSTAQAPQTAAQPRPYDAGQPQAQPTATTPAYGSYNPYGTPQTPAAVPDPYGQPAPAAVPPVTPAAPGYGTTPQGVAPDPAAAQPKPADYNAYGYGGYGDGTAAGYGGVTQPPAGYPAQPDAAPGYSPAAPSGGYQRAGAQSFHPYRR